MDESLLQIREHNGEGYNALVDHGDWRVAVLRFEDSLRPERQTSMERHLETDEVFVLTQGQGTLILGGNEPRVSMLSPQAMEIGKIYNIRRNAWHTVSLSPDASVVIVENRDTGEHNSEYCELTQEQRALIAELAA